MTRFALLAMVAALGAGGCSGASTDGAADDGTEAPAGGATSGGGDATAATPPAATPSPADDDLSGTPAPQPTDDETNAPSENGGTLRIMSYNIKVGSESSLAAVAQAIATEKPDIVGLQEVDDLTNRSGKVHQTDELAKLAGFSHRYFGANFAFDGGTYGLAILSRFPLVNPRVIRMDAHTTRANGYEPRIAVTAEITAYGKAISFVTMHASLHAEERAGNAQKVLAALGPARKPTVIVGDMNETPDNAIGNAFKGSGFVDAHYQKTTNPLAGWTAPATFPTRRIDFVYKDSGFGPTLFSWVPGTKSSDHRPVMVTFRTPG
jgi:endonuclease/exonuclease/phosphatase family metal-dependent hydrolase